MNMANKIDYSKLLGFESVEALISGSVDFQDDALAAKLGAKVGADPLPGGDVEVDEPAQDQ
jgi:hypothetical protein